MNVRAALFGSLALVAGAVAVADAPPGDHAEGLGWSVRLAPPTSRVGKPSTVSVQVSSRGGYHVNLDYPMAFRPSAESTVTFEGARIPLRPSSTSPCEGRPKESCSVTLDLPFVAPAAGEARLDGTLAFSVCSAERCLIEKVPLGTRITSR
jgi:hypothetical protein